MNPRHLTIKRELHQKHRRWAHIFLVCSLLLSGMTPLLPLVAPPVLAAPAVAPLAQSTNLLQINVVSARTEPDRPGGAVIKGAPISLYEYIINVDNTGDPSQGRNAGCSPADSGYPDSCNWPSIRAVPGAAPIFTQGNQSDLGPGITLPNGKYLISVIADGYKIDGEHFTVPLSGPVTVALQPHPLPPATIRVKVFEDISPVNGMFDAPAEQGLAGFRLVINDILGQLSTDVQGNPLCTTYDTAGEPNGQTNCLISDANGDIVVPNLGPNRYDVTVVPPDGSDWTETTTLEGGLSWDSWLQEGGTGLDNEFVVAGEPFPWTVFGFTRPKNNLAGGSGGVKGTIVGASVYVPQQGGLPYNGSIWDGFNGVKVTGPIQDAWVALSDLQTGDTAVYVGRANSDGTFQINGVPDGNYFFTWWDTNLYYILDWIQVTVSNGQIYDLGTPFLTGWFTPLDGYVFNDLNGNGQKDGGEPGIANYLVVYKDRENSEIDRMSIASTTDVNGYYSLPKAYPMGSWMILEAYNDRFYTTGVTYQVDNQPAPTTVLGAGVDVGVLPMLGQRGRLDWGVKPYDAAGTQGGPRNGGIVGTASYETTRNELDPRFLAVEGWQPGIPGLTVNLYAPVFCGTTGAPCDVLGDYELAPDGAYAKGQLLNSTVTETWEQPTDCIARDANGVALRYPEDQQVLPPNPAGKRCLEGPVMGTQFQSGFASLDGNYGFGDGCFGPGGYDPATEACADGSEPTALPGDDYLVEVEPGVDALGRPRYQVVREEDINVFGGDQFTPQVPPPACAGALHTVDVAGIGANGPNAVVNPSFVEAGGSPYEGQSKPLCDVKLVTLANGKSIAPLFNFFTRVPIPGKWKGYIIDDLTVSSNLQDLFVGEKAGAPNLPIGVYDFTNRLLTTVNSDPNGVYELLLPSTTSINCPSPSGVCPNVYYILGNDPGQPQTPNPNYNPQYRTIGTSFEIYPGLMIPSDLAPTQIVPGVLAGGSLFNRPPQCTLDTATPQIFAVSQPYVSGGSGPGRTITVQGQGFGASPGTVTLDGSTAGLTTSGWSDTQFSLTVATGVSVGAKQLQITATNGKRTVNGLTFHVIGGAYNPTLYPVGPGRTYATIQAAVNAAASAGGTQLRLVIVYPGTTAQWNPQGAYFENVVLYAPVMLQGVGPGGVRANGSTVLGSVIDGRGIGGDSPYATDWRNFVLGLAWDGNQAIYEGAVVYVVASNGEFTASRSASIDGFTIQGGDQQGFPNNLQPGDPTIHDFAAVQGGAVFANAYAQYMKITNNIVQSNGGAYGAIRLGTPHLPGALNDNQNDNIRIAYNRILANGGTNLAGAIGVYSGAAGYEIANNDICGNFSAEYGGGISHYGLSPNGNIHHNRIYFNRAYDEGGGIMIAGELQANPSTLTPGAGPVNVHANLIQANLSNDDGGGVRFLMAGNFAYNVYNNIIVNNVSTHEGGGVSLNDAPNVRFYNNTVMKNLTTASAVTSNGLPAPAGLASSRNSTLLQNSLPGGSPIFSNPLLFNNIFWENRAGTFTGASVAGIGLAGDPNPINYWDLGVSDGTGLLAPTNSILQTTAGTTASGTNSGSNPLVVAAYETSVSVAPWRGNPRFVDPLIVTVDAVPNSLGDYHLGAGSPAINLGAANKSGVNAPTTDFDNQTRPANGGFDSGADETSNTAPPPPPPPPAGPAQFYFSTSGNTNPPGMTGSADNADIYAWDGTTFSRVWDASASGLPGGANVDGLKVVDATHFYLSFDGTNTNVPTLGNVQDEDIVFYNNGAWSVYFDGTAVGLTNNNLDIDAFDFVGTTLYFSTAGNTNPPGAGGSGDDADIYRWNGGSSYTRIFDASAAGLSGGADVDALVVVDETHFYLSFNSTNTNVPSLGNVQDEDVVFRNGGVWSIYFDGTARGLTNNNHDLDGFDIASGASVTGDAGGSGAASGAVPFPQAPLLDTFSVADGALSASWLGDSSTNSFRVNSKRIESRANSGGSIWWNTAFGAEQEAFITLTKIGKSSSSTARWQGLMLKLNGVAPGDINASAIDVRYSSEDGVQVRTKAPGQGWVIQTTLGGVVLNNGDRLGARAFSNGTVIVYYNGDAVGDVNVTTGPNPWLATLAASGGSIGTTYNFKGGKFDDFGGGDAATIAAAALDESASTNEALGEIQTVDDATGVSEAEWADEAAYLNDPAIFDEEAVVYELFMPLVADQ